MSNAIELVMSNDLNGVMTSTVQETPPEWETWGEAERLGWVFRSFVVGYKEIKDDAQYIMVHLRDLET